MLRAKPIKTNLWFYMRYIIRLSGNTKERGRQLDQEKNSVHHNGENVDIADHDTEKTR